MISWQAGGQPVCSVAVGLGGSCLASVLAVVCASFWPPFVGLQTRRASGLVTWALAQANSHVAPWKLRQAGRCESGPGKRRSAR